MAETRRALHSYLTDPAFDAWHDYATEAGVSVSGLLEAIGRQLAEVAATGTDMSEHQPDLLKAARRIDAANRRRGPGH